VFDTILEEMGIGAAIVKDVPKQVVDLQFPGRLSNTDWKTIEQRFAAPPRQVPRGMIGIVPQVFVGRRQQMEQLFGYCFENWDRGLGKSALKTVFPAYLTSPGMGKSALLKWGPQLLDDPALQKKIAGGSAEKGQLLDAIAYAYGNCHMSDICCQKAGALVAAETGEDVMRVMKRFLVASLLYNFLLYNAGLTFPKQVGPLPDAPKEPDQILTSRSPCRSRAQGSLIFQAPGSLSLSMVTSGDRYWRGSALCTYAAGGALSALDAT